MKRTHYPGPLPEQFRQDAHAAGTAADIEHRVVLVDGLPCVGGQQQQTLRKELHQRVQNRVCTALDSTNGLHRGVDENGLSASQPHGSKILLKGLFCVCHAVSPFSHRGF